MVVIVAARPVLGPFGFHHGCASFLDQPDRAGGCLDWGGFVRAGGQVGYQQGFTNAAADGLAVVNHCAAGEGTGMTREPASDPKGRPTLAWRARRSDQR